MPRPSEKAKKIHRNTIPIQIREEKQSDKQRQKQDHQITFDIQQNISR